MIVTPLSSSAAFNSGPSLWIVGEPDRSVWSRKCDWYLNYQLSAALRRAPIATNPQVKEIFGEAGYQLELKNQDSSATPILISPHLRLPPVQLVFVPSKSSTDAWFSSIVEIWRGLDRPSMRIFLPEKISAADCEDFFRRVDEVVDISFVTD